MYSFHFEIRIKFHFSINIPNISNIWASKQRQIPDSNPKTIITINFRLIKIRSIIIKLKKPKRLSFWIRKIGSECESLIKRIKNFILAVPNPTRQRVLLFNGILATVLFVTFLVRAGPSHGWVWIPGVLDLGSLGRYVYVRSSRLLLIEHQKQMRNTGRQQSMSVRWQEWCCPFFNKNLT